MTSIISPVSESVQSLHLAIGAGESSRAGAAVGAHVVGAGAAVLAGLALALIDLLLAVEAAEARPAATRVGVDPLHTGAIVQAGTKRERS